MSKRKDKERLGRECSYRVNKMPGELLGAFCWHDTKEGHAYWNRVYTKLNRIKDLYNETISNG